MNRVIFLIDWRCALVRGIECVVIHHFSWITQKVQNVAKELNKVNLCLKLYQENQTVLILVSENRTFKDQSVKKFWTSHHKSRQVPWHHHRRGGVAYSIDKLPKSIFTLHSPEPKQLNEWWIFVRKGICKALTHASDIQSTYAFFRFCVEPYNTRVLYQKGFFGSEGTLIMQWTYFLMSEH